MFMLELDAILCKEYNQKVVKTIKKMNNTILN